MVRLVLLCIVVAWTSVAHAEKRVALVIGNGAYQKVSQLSNPPNDAKAVDALLRVAGFDEVVLRENLGIRELRQAIKDFSDSVRDADVAVVYYSGHGIEVNGINYIVPVDGVLDRDIDVPYEAYSLDNLLQVLEPARRLRLVMLDACRDNPFTRSMKRTIGSRAVGRGLAPVEPTTVNTLIGFAAKAGSIALDGEGGNSPYATAVLNHLSTPGLDLRIAFGRVRDEVLQVTHNKQEPFVYGSLGGTEIALVPTKASQQAATTATTPSQQTAPTTSLRPEIDYNKEMEIVFWNAVKDAKSKDLLQAYLDRYPAGNFAGLARVLIEQLGKQQAPTRLATAEPYNAKPNEDTSVDTEKLVRALQTELKRVGCNPGEVDGVWGSKAKGALAEFARLAHVTLPSDAPTSEMLQAVLSKKSRVCPLVCDDDEVERDGQCVGRPRPPRLHRVRRPVRVHVERPRERAQAPTLKLCFGARPNDISACK